MGALNSILVHCFKSLADNGLHALENKLDNAIAQFPEGAFIRLGSRSPKDTILGVVGCCRVYNGKQAIDLLSSGSRRVAYDLSSVLQTRYQPWIFVRQWQEIPWHMEFRCFMKNRRLIGVSQYFYETPFPALALPMLSEAIRPILEAFFLRFVQCCPLTDVVFDVAIFLHDAPHVKLLK